MNHPITTPPALPAIASADTCHRESAGNYDRVVLQIEPLARVIECADRIQWIIQRLEGVGTAPTARWRSVRYVRDRESLIALLGRDGYSLTSEQRQVVDALPDIIGEEPDDFTTRFKPIPTWEQLMAEVEAELEAEVSP